MRPFTIELIVPGGNPVPTSTSFANLGDKDNDNIPDLTLKFSRQALIGSIQSGIAAGLVQSNGLVEVRLRATLRNTTTVRDIGSTTIRVLDRGR